MQSVQLSPRIQTKKELLIKLRKEKSCFQIRENLDAVFGGNSPLETAGRELKKSLFEHLQFCSQCCRAFDARVRYRAYGRNRIY